MRVISKNVSDAIFAAVALLENIFVIFSGGQVTFKK
jgi:hypothetical protein